MKKRFATTAIALLVFCALFFYANVYEVDVIPEPGKDKPVQLASTANTEVKAIAWRAGTPAEIRVQSEASGTEKIWKIVKPAVYKADLDVVSSIIQTFSEGEIGEVSRSSIVPARRSSLMSLIVRTGEANKSTKAAL